MKTPEDIIAFAEQYRDFHFIPGNTYNPDVIEKIWLAEALLKAVDILKSIKYDTEDLKPPFRNLPPSGPKDLAVKTITELRAFPKYENA